jgi:hypothetical protein
VTPTSPTPADRLAALLHDLEATQHFVRHEPADGYVTDEPTEIIECLTGVDGHMEDAARLIAAGVGFPADARQQERDRTAAKWHRLRWAALWLVSLIDDGRIDDLDPDDEYIRWAREAAADARGLAAIEGDSRG